LGDACESTDWSICGQVPAMRKYRDQNPRASLSEFFLWGGPVDAAGGADAVARYAPSVNSASVRLHPVRLLALSTSHFGSQLIRVATGDGIVREGEGMAIVRTLKTLFPNAVYQQFARSRQQTASLHFESQSQFHIAVLALALAVLLGLGPAAFRTDRKLFSTVFLLLAGVVANAFVMGALSGVYDRYQSRVAWLLLLAAVMLSYRRFASSGRTVRPIAPAD
jgi:hypothetical protein